MLVGFIQDGKVKLFKLKPEENLGHEGLIEAGAVIRTPDLRGFSVYQNLGRSKIVAFSDVNPKPNQNLRPAVIKQLQKLFGIRDVWTIDKL